MALPQVFVGKICAVEMIQVKTLQSVDIFQKQVVLIVARSYMVAVMLIQTVFIMMDVTMEV
ncbi:MAG: hypothetical protein WC749_07790 [Dehalococcoidia bacterium]